MLSTYLFEVESPSYRLYYLRDTLYLGLERFALCMTQSHPITPQRRLNVCIVSRFVAPPYRLRYTQFAFIAKYFGLLSIGSIRRIQLRRTKVQSL